VSRTALILAAHGSRVDPTINAPIDEYVAQIDRLGLFDHVAKAFHRGEPTFAAVLDQLDADEVTVVPVMTSDGYYCDVVLPRELAKNRRFARVRLRQTPPVGVHPGAVAVVERRARRLILDHDLETEDVCVAVVGHGTPRHPRSRLATVRLAEALEHAKFCGQVLYAFLEEEPSVQSIVDRSATSAIVVIPFLISGGPHATVDIPVRLGVSTNALERWGEGLDGTPGSAPPFHGRVGHRFIVCDSAIGTHPVIVDIIIDLAREAPPFRTRSASDGPRPRAGAWGSDGNPFDFSSPMEWKQDAFSGVNP